MNILETIAPLGTWTAAEDPNENIFGDGIGCDILDAAGFPICEIPAGPILHNWPAKFPGMQHWADGAHDGRTEIARTPEQLAAIVRLVQAAPKTYAALVELQANPNSPRAHRAALDAIARNELPMLPRP